MQQTHLLQASIPNLSHVNKKKHSIEGIPVYTGEFWTARQRQMHTMHYAISYRASFKPELPDYFIKRFINKKSNVVLDPFGGRGTTTLQANLMGNAAIHNDRNPVSLFLIKARQNIPSIEELEKIIWTLPVQSKKNLPDHILDKRLLPFFHKRTLSEIYRLRTLILNNSDFSNKALNYIGLTAMSRLHGHSDGFFSVYSFPQISILPQAQARNNKNRGLRPEYRPIQERILKKIKADLAQPIPTQYIKASKKNKYINEDARNLTSVKNNAVDLIVTSPPFLNKVNYFEDNWMRAWFLGLEDSFKKTDLTTTPNLGEWKLFMKDVMFEMGRVLKQGGHAVIEVGEVEMKKKIINLEEELFEFLPMKVPGGKLIAREILINQQNFTKLSNCWDVSNNKKGTNSNRCLILKKINL